MRSTDLCVSRCHTRRLYACVGVKRVYVPCTGDGAITSMTRATAAWSTHMRSSSFPDSPPLDPPRSPRIPRSMPQAGCSPTIPCGGRVGLLVGLLSLYLFVG